MPKTWFLLEEDLHSLLLGDAIRPRSFSTFDLLGSG